jgi:hypothetical protein
LWYHYDDCQDHKVVASKEEWDYFQRLLLILKSDAELQHHSRRVWSSSQVGAGLALAGFVWCATSWGWGENLLILAIPFGAFSILISQTRRRLHRDDHHSHYPFESIGQLAAVRRQVGAAFSKRRWPTHLESRAIRSRTSAFGVALQFYSAWLVLGPLALLWQLLPARRVDSSVVLEGSRPQR